MSESVEQRLSALIDAGISLASELDLDSLLQRIADISRQVIGASYGAVGVVSADGTLERFVHSGVDEETVQKIGRLPEGRGLLGTIIEEGRPLRLREISDYPDSVGFPENHPEMHSFLGVPIMGKERVYGRLYLAEKQSNPEFSLDDERIALLFAAQASVAIENSLLYEEIRTRKEELAILEERDRISKELHDGVIQGIYSIGLSLQGTMSLLKRDPDLAAKRIDQAIAELDNLVRDVRSYIFELRPKSLDEKGLGPAIQELVRDLEVNTLAQTSVSLDDDALDSLSEANRIQVVQILREILSNIARHSGAQNVNLTCEKHGENLTMTIDDDGVGFDTAAVARGQGLTNIEERAARIGGEVFFLPREPRGTRSIVRIPVK